jgi:hypothetical protein
MERFWNIVHYFVYRGDLKLTLLFNYINPFRWICFIPVVRNFFYTKQGFDIVEEIEKTQKRPDIGLSSIIAGGIMNSLGFFICLALVNLFYGFNGIAMNLRLYHFMIMVGVSLVANYFLLFKKNKYLAYFKEFEKMSQKNKRKWSLISLGVVIGIVLFLIGSFFILLEGQGRQ